MRYKHKGVTLAATAIAIVAWMFLGYISFIVMASPFSVLAAVRTARQAEQYAEFVANSLKLVDYSELGTAAHARQSLTGEISGAAGWESRVAIGAEQQIGSNPDNLQRIATIDIFQTGDTLSRYTLQVPLSSAGSGSGGDISIENLDFTKTKTFVRFYGHSNPKNIGNPNYAYTAPDDGYIYMSAYCGDEWSNYFGILINGIDTQRTLWRYGKGGACAFFPVKKSTTVRFATGGNGYSIGPVQDGGNASILFVPLKKS